LVNSDYRFKHASTRSVLPRARHKALFAALTDGRVPIVNRESKLAEPMAGPVWNHWSCRVPMAEEIDAEFKADKAKLKWAVSIEGTKMTSETHKILGVLAKGSVAICCSTLLDSAPNQRNQCNRSGYDKQPGRQKTTTGRQERVNCAWEAESRIVRQLSRQQLSTTSNTGAHRLLPTI
jgi:hypothetical protein